MNEPTTTAAPQINNAPAAASESTIAVDGQIAETPQAQAPVDTGKAGNSEGNAAEAPKGAPEKYEFKAPEGRQFDNEVMSSFSEIAKELNLSQESAQKMLDTVGPKMAQRQAQQIDAMRQEWATTSQADKEFGGEKIAENLTIAKRALDTFGTPQLRSLLNESGLGNHPELIRFFFRAGKAISEDQYVVGNGSSAPSKAGPRDFASAAAALYSTQNS